MNDRHLTAIEAARNVDWPKPQLEDPVVDLIMAVIFDSITVAATASHRPDDVRRFWLDANSRYVMAYKIRAALDEYHRTPPEEGQ